MHKLNKIILKLLGTFCLLIPLSACIMGGGADASKRLLSASSETTSNQDATTDASTDLVIDLRPNKEIYIADYCACQAAKPDIINNCKIFCQGRNDKNPTLYVSVTLGPDIVNNADIKNLYGWCNNPLPGSDNPACQIEAYDGETFRYIDVSVSSGNSNRFTANISSLDKNKAYILTLVENNSGSNARSESFQIIRKDYSEVVFQGPLKITPVHQYACIFRGVTAAPTGYPAGTNNNESAYKLYYFYPDANTPPALPLNVTPYTYCHDIITYGEEDQKIFPRLELTPNALYFWNETDYRFYDNDGNSKLDINDLIQKQLLADYAIVQDINLFTEQKWWQYPAIDSSTSGSSSSSSSGTSNASTPRLGFIMQSLRNANTGFAYCPTQTQYNSNEPLFKILKVLVGVNTEGLYLAIRDPESYTDKTGTLVKAPDSYVLLRESLLKQIWFYYENGRHYTPTEANAGDKTLMFYWPADTSYPYVKKPGQRIYTVKHLSELNNINSSGPRPEYVPSDRRIGCIPAHGN